MPQTPGQREGRRVVAIAKRLAHVLGNGPARSTSRLRLCRRFIHRNSTAMDGAALFKNWVDRSIASLTNGHTDRATEIYSRSMTPAFTTSLVQGQFGIFISSKPMSDAHHSN